MAWNPVGAIITAPRFAIADQVGGTIRPGDGVFPPSLGRGMELPRRRRSRFLAYCFTSPGPIPPRPSTLRRVRYIKLMERTASHRIRCAAAASRYSAWPWRPARPIGEDWGTQHSTSSAATGTIGVRRCGDPLALLVRRVPRPAYRSPSIQIDGNATGGLRIRFTCGTSLTQPPGQHDVNHQRIAPHASRTSAVGYPLGRQVGRPITQKAARPQTRTTPRNASGAGAAFVDV